MITTITDKTLVSTIVFDILDPGTAESRIAIATGKLTGAVKSYFKSAEINIFLCRRGKCLIKSLYGIYFAFVNTVTDSIHAHVFDFPAVLTAGRTFAGQHLCAILFLQISVVYGLGVGLDCFCINGMCRRMMTTGGLA